jgi:hypothetical protein
VCPVDSRRRTAPSAKGQLEEPDLNSEVWLAKFFFGSKTTSERLCATAIFTFQATEDREKLVPTRKKQKYKFSKKKDNYAIPP